MACAQKDSADDIDCSVITSSAEEKLQNKGEEEELSAHDEKSSEMKEETANKNECFDIYFVIDTTASMTNYIRSLHSILQQLFSMIKILFANKCHLHIISYTDYCDKTGRMIQECHSNNSDDLLSFVETKLDPRHGGDYPEAAKTALNVLYQNIMDNTDNNGNNIGNISDNIIVFVYTDAPPHHKTMSYELHYTKELTYLANSEPGFDWIKICMSFRHLKMKSNKNIDFYTIMEENIGREYEQFWKLLGNVIEIPDKDDKTIAQATIGIISQLMGNKNKKEYDFAANFKVLKYNPTHTYQAIVDNNTSREIDFNEMLNDYKEFEAFSLKYNENDCMRLLPWTGESGTNEYHYRPWLLKDENFLSLKPLSYMMNIDVDLKQLPNKMLNDSNFTDLVFYEFENNIFTIENIICLSYNNVFGKLWRYLCKLREDDRLKQLQDKFSQIKLKLSPDDRDIVNDWLQKSYDDTEDINKIILDHLETLKFENEQNPKNSNNNNNNNNNFSKIDNTAENENSDKKDESVSEMNEQKGEKQDSNEASDKLTDSNTNRNEEHENKDDMMVEYFILDKGASIKLPSQKELLKLANGINQDIIGKIQGILTHLMIYQKNIKNGPPIEAQNNEMKDDNDDDIDWTELYITGIPCSLSDEQVFSLLSHLVVKGTKFSLPSSLTMAMICYLSQNKILCQRAKNLLKKYKGKWILLDKLDIFGQFLALAFIYLAMRCDSEMIKHEINEHETKTTNTNTTTNNENEFGILTNEERYLFKNVIQIYLIRAHKNEKFEIEIGCETTLQVQDCALKHDLKMKCKMCDEYRSFTLMLSNDICGLCYQMQHNPKSFIKTSNIIGNDFIGIPFGGGGATLDCEIYDEKEMIEQNREQVPNSHDMSYMTRCSQCNVNYAISNVKLFEKHVSKPLCFDCRNNYGTSKTDIHYTIDNNDNHRHNNNNKKGIFKLACYLCKTKWMCPNRNSFDDIKKWIGPCCEYFENNQSFIEENNTSNNENKQERKRITVDFEDILNRYPIIILPIFLNLSIENGDNINVNMNDLRQFKNDFVGVRNLSLYKLYLKYKDTYLSHLTKQYIKWNDGIFGLSTNDKNENDNEMKEMKTENNNNNNNNDDDDTAVETRISGLEAKNTCQKPGINNRNHIGSLIEKLSKDGIYYNHKLIHNIEQLILSIDNKINHGIAKLKDVCYLCFENKSLHLLDSACGNCNNYMCIDCLHSWYNQCKAGKIILATHLLCPFCKNKPKVSTLKKYNKNICNIIQCDKNLVNKLATNYNEYYFGWCIKCYQIKTAFERRCGDAANINDMIDNINNFKCGNCKEREIMEADGKLMAQVKRCPQCDAPTYLIDGCNHITCPCGCHWCYKCGEEFDEDDIYDHMQQEHGGYWN